jgi:hypothetical protein
MNYINISLLSLGGFNYDSYHSVVELPYTTLHVTKVAQSYKHLTNEIGNFFDLLTN